MDGLWLDIRNIKLLAIFAGHTSSLFFFPFGELLLVCGLEHGWIMTSNSVGNVIIPTEELHHSEGYAETTNQTTSPCSFVVASNRRRIYGQWEFQDPKMEG